MYTKGDGSFYRSLLLSFYNGLKRINYTTKGYKYNLVKPRLVIFAAGHPQKMAERFGHERNLDQAADGYFSRMLISNPKKNRISLSN